MLSVLKIEGCNACNDKFFIAGVMFESWVVGGVSEPKSIKLGPVCFLAWGESCASSRGGGDVAVGLSNAGGCGGFSSVSFF